MEIDTVCPPAGFLPPLQQQQQQEHAVEQSSHFEDDEVEEDERIEWLRKRACGGLDIPDPVFTAFLLNDQAVLINFLENPSASWLILYTFISSARDTPRLSLSLKSAGSTASAPSTTPSSSSSSGSMELHAYTGSNPKDLGRTPENMMYFMKLKAGGFKTCQDLDVGLEYGVLPAGPSLDSLEQLLLHLFLPLLAREDTLGESKFWGLKDTCLVDRMGNELLSNMQKVLSQVSNAKQALTQATQLSIPSLPPDCLDKAEVDYELLLELETAANDWLPIIEATMQQETQKIPMGQNPLSELDFWRERVHILSNLHRQLSSQIVKNIMAVLEVGSSNIELLQSFKSLFADLNKLFLEAKDNVNFLTTLERHFKTIHKEPMSKVLETIAPMMNALRMVWVISRYYSDDLHMGGLMERIASQIAERVTEDINLKTLFKLPALEAFIKIRTAKSVLDSWSEIYLQVRERIELGGRDPRWEFDRKRLFERTTYMSLICADLLTIVEVINDFLNFLGPELKAVTGDIEGIDSVIQKVLGMVENVEKLPFNVFDKSYALQWSATMSNFNMDRENIEHLTKAFIDSSFKKLRSAEGALDLLQNFKSIKSEGAINKQMTDKFNDIIAQFLKEIDTTREIFQQNVGAPLSTRNQPPVAGSINWARCLFGRLKKTMQKFEMVGSNMMNDPTAQQMNIYYCNLAKQMLNFEKHWAGQWAQSVSQQAVNYLKQPILSKNADGKIIVNFHTNLLTIIRETKYLDAMGFQLPETALNITLQEGKFNLYIENIQTMLQQYNKATRVLTSVESKLLSYHLATLQQVLEPGFSNLNWNSLGIPDFVSFCTKAINEFKSLVNQVQNNASSIEKAVEAVASTNLVQENLVEKEDEFLEFQELYERLEQERCSAVSEALKQYRSISPLLMKLEEIVVSTNTGKSPVLVDYYHYWEQKIFEALIDMVLKGLVALQSLFQSKKNSARQQQAGKLRRFKINFYLNKPDVLAQPPLSDVSGVLNHLVRTIVTSAKTFVRWMDGSCLETPEQRLGEDSEPYVFNFYAEVSSNPQIIKKMLILGNQINNAIFGIQKNRRIWKN